jgi:hypothetical protein
VQRWRKHGLPCDKPKPALRWRPRNQASYAYLFGIYLGDGYISKASTSPVLEIALDAKYPKVVGECVAAIWDVARIRARTCLRSSDLGTSVRVTAGGQIWALAFPQHGPGKKHRRTIELADWQQSIVGAFPRQFLRGLVHSDGARTMNRFQAQLADGPREYSYSRYFFTNLSPEIRGFFCASCDRLDIRWTQSSHKNIPVADRRSVAMLDSFIGPKS